MDPKLQIEGHRISKTMRFHLKLLAEIKPYPCLYDHTNPNYNNTIVRQKIWLQIANELNQKVKKCQDRCKYLKGKLKMIPGWMENEHFNSRRKKDHILLLEAGDFMFSNKSKILKSSEMQPCCNDKNSFEPEETLRLNSNKVQHLCHTPNEIFLLSLVPSLDQLTYLSQAKVKANIFNLIEKAIEQEENVN